MEEEQYRALMDAISTSKKEVEGKLTETLEKLRFCQEGARTAHAQFRWPEERPQESS